MYCVERLYGVWSEWSSCHPGVHGWFRGTGHHHYHMASCMLSTDVFGRLHTRWNGVKSRPRSFEICREGRIGRPIIIDIVGKPWSPRRSCYLLFGF